MPVTHPSLQYRRRRTTTSAVIINRISRLISPYGHNIKKESWVRVCERLAQVITRQCGGRELNQRHVDHTEILPLAYSTELQKWSRRYRSCRLEYIMWPSMKVCTHYHFQQFDMSRFVFRLLIQSGVGMAPWKNRTSRYISFFPPITQWCSISDILFTGGRVVSDFVLKFY